MRSLRFLYRRCILFLVNAISLYPSNKFVMVLKRLLMKGVGSSIGENCELSENFYIHDGRNFMLGSGARIGAYFKAWDFCPIRIGKNLLCSHGVTMISGSHEIYDLSPKKGPIEIGDDVWIGINVTILGPVKVGDRAVIGACSLVRQDVPQDTVWAGIPARMISHRNQYVQGMGMQEPSREK